MKGSAFPYSLGAAFLLLAAASQLAHREGVQEAVAPPLLWGTAALMALFTLAKEGEAQGVGLYYQEPDRPYPPERLSPLELARRLAELKSKSPSFYPGRWRPLEGDHLTLFLAAAPTPDRLALAARSGAIFIAPGHGDDDGFSLLTFPRGKRAE